MNADTAVPVNQLDQPSRGTENMNECLKTGFYPWCTQGRPAGSVGAFSLAVRRSTTPDYQGYYTVHQVAFGREAELGQVWTRMVFDKGGSASDDTNYMDWIRVDGGGQEGGMDPEEVKALLLSTGVGVCGYETGNVAVQSMSTTKVAAISYVAQWKVIAAQGTDGKWYNDWRLTEAVEPACWNDPEYLGERSSHGMTPYPGKPYLMNRSSDGHMLLGLWNGTDMVVLMDFDATLSRITNIEEKITPKIKTYSEASGTVEIDLSYDVVVADINIRNLPSSLNFSGSPASGHRTTVYIYNSDTSGIHRVPFSSDQASLYMVNGVDNAAYVAPNGFLRVDAVYMGTGGLKEIYLTLENNVGLLTGGRGEIFNDYANNEASGKYSHAEGYGTEALANYSHAQGYYTKVMNPHSAGGFAAGMYNFDKMPGGSFPHPHDLLFMFGIGTSEEDRKNALTITREGEVYILNIGGYDGTSITGATPLHKLVYKTAGLPTEEGGEIFNNYTQNVASGQYSHAEGHQTKATATCAHAEGYSTIASDDGAHAEGHRTEASGFYSHSEGGRTMASNKYEHAEGLLNKSNPGTRHSIGIGTEQKLPTIPEHIRRNAFEVMDNGDVYVFGIGGYDGTNTGTDGVQTLQEVISSILQSQNSGA